jgi:deoxyribonucleoside regulator
VAAENREEFLARVASLYYEHDYNQEEIAQHLHVTRSNVSRLLKEAKQRGLVEIRIRKRIPTATALERELRTRFGLQHALVVESQGRGSAENLSSAGQLAADYLSDILEKNSVLAISWGTGVAAAVTAFAQNPTREVDVVQMIGSVGTVESWIDGPDLARELALKLGGRYYYLAAPLFVDTPLMRDMLIGQPTVCDTLDRARAASVALLGIGTTEPGASSFLRAGHLTDHQVAQLRLYGAVGETAGRHFDIDGKDEFEINRRVISLNLAEVKAIPQVIAVACGIQKQKSILGALRGGYVKILATDDITAKAVLALAKG